MPSAGPPGTDGAAGDVKPVGVFWAANVSAPLKPFSLPAPNASGAVPPANCASVRLSGRGEVGLEDLGLKRARSSTPLGAVVFVSAGKQSVRRLESHETPGLEDRPAGAH